MADTNCTSAEGSGTHPVGARAYQFATVFDFRAGPDSGDAVKKRPREVAELFRAAAEQGHLPAQTALGNIYLNGEGLSRNFEKARFWLEKAAGRGDPRAEYYLGIACFNGQGFPRDAGEAKRRLAKAADAGFEPAADLLRRIDTFSDPSASSAPGSSLNLIPGGKFTMGCLPDEAGWAGDITMEVELGDFYLAPYPVTQKEWEEIGVRRRKRPSFFKGDDLPVEQVSWFDAIEYCNQRSIREGLTPVYRIPEPGGPSYSMGGINVIWDRNIRSETAGYRLPTEAEWEYACRAGTHTPFNTGDQLTTDQANFDGHYPYTGEEYPYNLDETGLFRNTTTLVGTFPPNAWGLYDMHGNVNEWCWDIYGRYEAPAGAILVDPAGPPTGTDRVKRGGSWRLGAEHALSVARNWGSVFSRSENTGFRVARSC
jgi:formylglycine-generating enzyme required for sulfatase activity